MLMPFKAFDQTSRLLVSPRRLDHQLQTFLNPMITLLVGRCIQCVQPVTQTNRITNKTFEFLGKAGPINARVLILLDSLKITASFPKAKIASA